MRKVQLEGSAKKCAATLADEWRDMAFKRAPLDFRYLTEEDTYEGIPTFYQGPIAASIEAQRQEVGEPQPATGEPEPSPASLADDGIYIDKLLVPLHAPLFGPTGLPLRDDVEQGKIGNCYMACGFQLLAQHYPEQVQNCIRQVSGPKGEIWYEVHLLGKYGDRRKVIVVDNTFWCADARSCAPVYMSSPTAVLWPLVLEKAMACFKGKGYEGIVAGNADDVVHAVSGTEALAACQVDVSRKGPDVLYDEFVDVLGCGGFICAGTHGTHKHCFDEDGEASGLYGNHIYTIENAAMVNGEPCFHLRNVHNRYHSAAETPTVEELTPLHTNTNRNAQGKVMGHFRIGTEDFVKWFETYTLFDAPAVASKCAGTNVLVTT